MSKHQLSFLLHISLHLDAIKLRNLRGFVDTESSAYSIHQLPWIIKSFGLLVDKWLMPARH